MLAMITRQSVGIMAYMFVLWVSDTYFDQEGDLTNGQTGEVKGLEHGNVRMHGFRVLLTLEMVGAIGAAEIGCVAAATRSTSDDIWICHTLSSAPSSSGRQITVA